MKIVKFSKREDYGTDYYAQFFFTKRWSLMQICVGWNDFASWPYVDIKSGSGSLLAFTFWVYKFNFEFGLIERAWNWDYLKEVDDEGEVS